MPWHERAVSDPDQEHFVAETDTTVTGFLVLACLHHGDGVIELRRMVVHPAHRRAGLAGPC